MKQEIRFLKWDCILSFAKYPNGRTAIRLIDKHDGSPIAMATLNMPEIALADNEILVKDYSENRGMAQAFIDYGIASEVERINIDQFGGVANVVVMMLN
jgi:hypothetical protein